jgi:hypothetical protein
MGKKKSKSKAKARKAKTKVKATPPAKPPLLDTLKKLGEIVSAFPTKMPRTDSVVEPLVTVQPPENFAEHLKRIGAEQLPRIMDVMIGDEPTECLVIPWEALQAAEYNYLASGVWKGTGIGKA